MTLLSQRKAADHVGCHPDTLRKAIRAGHGPRSYVIAKRPLYDVRDLDAWMLKRRR